MDRSFPKIRRLTLTSEFRQVRENGRAQHSKLLILSVLHTDSDPEIRYGVITSRRVGPAVVRNRVRRRLREIFRLHQSEIQPGHKIVAIARPTAATVTFQRLESDWLQLARRASIVCAR